MSEKLQILFNSPKTEVSREGYRLYRMAESITFGRYIVGEETEDGGKIVIGNWKETDSDTFMRHPFTQAIILTPSGLKSNLYEDGVLFEDSRIDATEWNYNTDEFEVIKFQNYTNQSGSYESFSAKTDSAATPLTTISVEPKYNAYLSAFTAGTMVWTHETNDAISESGSFGINVQPYGTLGSKGSRLISVAFGGNQIIELSTTGKANYYIYIGEEWKKVATFAFSKRNVSGNSPFKLDVLPSSQGTVTFIFSDGLYSEEKGSVAHKKQTKNATFTFDLTKYFTNVQFYPILGYTACWPAAPILVAQRKINFRCVWNLYKNIYETDIKSQLCLPEILMEKKEQGGMDLDPYGIKSTDTFAAGKPWFSAIARNTDGTTNWTVDDLISPVEIFMRASQFQTPELWGYRMYIPDETFTPNWTPIDFSQYFTKLSFTKSLDGSDPKTGRLECIFDNKATDLFRTYGTVDILSRDKKIFEGYVKENRPTIYGASGFIKNDFQIEDILCKLKETTVGFDLLTNVPLTQLITRMLQQCGFTLEQIQFGEDDEEWLDQQFITGEGGSDQQDKLFESTTLVSDALESIFEKFGRQNRHPLSIYYDDGIIKIESLAYYEEGVTPIDAEFYTGDISGVYDDDNDRYEDKKYFAVDNIELNVFYPEFNAVQIIASKNTSADSKGAITTITGNSESYFDDTSANFLGRIKMHKFSGNELFDLTTQESIEKYARFVMQEFGQKKIVANWVGEYYKDVNVNQFCKLYVIVQDNTGMPVNVCLGVFLITEVSPEILYDNGASEWSYRADYTAQWVAEFGSEGYPYFTTINEEE